MGLWACWFSVLSFLVFLFVTSSPCSPSCAPSRSLTPASASLGVFCLLLLVLSGSLRFRPRNSVLAPSQGSAHAEATTGPEG